MRFPWVLLVITILTTLVTSSCDVVQRCSCINSSNTLLCTASSCKTVFFPSTVFTYNHLVFTPDQGCKPCSYTCRVCSSETLCFQCENEYYLQNMTCLPCSTINCLSCDNQTCLACQTGYYLDQTTGLCELCPMNGTNSCPSSSTISSCQPSYYLSNDGANCLQCDPNCNLCVSATQCGTCQSGYYLSAFKCFKCLTGCLTCQSANACSSCPIGTFLGSDGACASCSIRFPSCSSCTANSCLACSSNSYPKNATYCSTLPTHTPIPNCLVYTSNMSCQVCQLGYFPKLGQCLPFCSSLCVNCSGPHFGLCFSCSSDSYLFNMNCVPFYNVQGGLAYQYLITPRNNPSAFTPSTPLYCLQPLVGGSSKISYTLDRIAGYQIQLKWKIYVNNISSGSVSYAVRLSNSIDVTESSFNNQTGALNLCTLTNLEYIEKNKITFTKISQTNLLQFDANSNSQPVLIAISELIIVVSRCGGLYGTNCLVCSSFNNCTACRNASNYLFGADCVVICPGGYYTYEPTKTCYQSCPIGSYNINSNLTCIQCPTICTSCVNQNTCLTCVSGYFLNQKTGKCVLSCPDRFYGNNASNTCDACIYPCLTCRSAVACTSCYFGFLDTITSTCLSNCPEGYYRNLTNNYCESCNSTNFSCLTCLNSNQQCLSCDTTKPFLLNYTCLVDCPTGYYKNLNLSACSLCRAQCRSCKNSADECTACNSGYLLNSSCTSCPEGYFPDEFTVTCKKCDSACASCTKNGSHCQRCNQPYLHLRLASVCLSNCPDRYYSANGQCIPCLLPCMTCSSATTCLSCASLFLYGSLCVQAQNCPTPTFPSLQNFTCSLCNPNGSASGCLTCNSVTNCTSCLINFLLFNSTCLPTCPSQYFAKQAVCISCITPCLACTNQTTCTSCRNGYYFLPEAASCTTTCEIGFYLDQNNCLRCDQTCSSCLRLNHCLTCTFPYLLNPFNISNNTRMCTEACPAGYFGQQLVCKMCQMPCLTCVDSLRCLTCLPGYGLQYLFSCVSNCIPGTFNFKNQSCQMCQSPCVTCIGSASNCTTCIIGLLLTNGTCVSSCINGYFRNSFTESCDICASSCLTCFGNESNCTSCRGSLLYLGQCIPSCPSSMYAENSSCISCVSPCFSCTNASHCLSCVSNYFLNNDTMQCVSQCPQTKYGQVALQLCLSCVYPCRRCSDYLNCLSCLNGAYFQSQCLPNCPIGTYEFANKTQFNLSVCTRCPAACKSCLNDSYCLTCSDSTLYLFNGQCISTCPEGLYGQTFTGECLPCMKVCNTCIDSFTCSSCASGYLYKNQCIAYCPLGYIGQNNTCLTCDSGCLTCLANTNRCLSCVSQKYLSSETCVDSCPYGFFPFPTNQTCIVCKSPCESCSDAYSCDSCMYGYILYRGVEANQCVMGPYCPNSYYLNENSNQCVSLQNCPANYLKQYTHRTCSQTCPDDYVAFNPNFTCLTQCPNGYWVDSNLVCQIINSSTPILPELSCKPFTVRNLLTFYCKINLESLNLKSLTESNVSLSVDGTTSIQQLSNNLLTFVLFPQAQQLFYIATNISLLKRYGVRSTRYIPLQRNPISVMVKRFDSYSSSNRQIGIFMYEIASSLGQGAVILWLVGIIRNRGIESLNMLELLQNLYVLCFLQIDYAPNLGQFLEGFKVSAFEFLPKFIKPQNQENCMTKFYVIAGGASFISNFMPCILVLLVFLLVFSIMQIAKKIIQKKTQSAKSIALDKKEQQELDPQQQKSAKLLKKVVYLIQRFNLDYCNDSCYVVSLPLFLYATAQFTYVNDQLAYFSAAVAFILAAGLIVGISLATYHLYKRTPNWISRLEFCYRGIREQITIGIYIFPAFYCERLLRAIVIVLAYDNESFLLGALVMLSLCKLVVFLHHPYAVNVTNYFHIILQGLWIIVYASLAVGLLNDDFTVANKLALGWASCVIIMIMILLTVIYASAQLLIFEWFEWQDRNVLKNRMKKIKNSTHNLDKQAREQSQDEEPFQMMKTQRINSFFSKADLDVSRSSLASQINIIKKNFMFEESDNNDQNVQNQNKNHILIKCIKKGCYQQSQNKIGKNSQHEQQGQNSL